MKQEFKVGDWVKVSYWNDFYEVVKVEDDSLYVKDNESGYIGEYSSVYHQFSKKKEPMKNKIDPNKKYRKVGTHEPVRIICVDRVSHDNEFPVLALIMVDGGYEQAWMLTAYGNNPYSDIIIEEVPQTDWSKVQVDTLIWVNGSPRYFAKYSTYMVYYFTDGTTSKTNVTGMCSEFNHNCSLEEPR